MWLADADLQSPSMNRILSLLLPAAFAVLVTWAPGAGAATLGDGDYARIGVPDLAQAATFFHDVLDCRPLGSASPAGTDASGSQLLSCGDGSMLELFAERGDAPARSMPARTESLQFVSDDALHTGAWLRQRGVVVSRPPHRLTSGPWAGRMALDFIAPWGLRIRLLGRDATAVAATRGH